MAEARVGTVMSYLEVLDAMGLQEGTDYRYVSGTEIKITFLHNGSIIQFVPLDHTKDREWRKIKSINATKTSVDEVDGVMHSGFVMLSSRAGRRNRNGAPACTVATCNPNETWVKEHVYTPWKNGALPPNVCVIEFEMEDSFLFSTGYYERFKDNPEQWRQRYLKNNWDYLDDEGSLFKMRLLDRIHTDTYTADDTGYLGIDVAREGKDRSVFCEIRGNVLTNIKVYTREDFDRLALPDEKDAPPYSIILGREALSYALKRGIGYSNAAGDAVGNGGGMIDYLRSQGFKLNEFKAGAAPVRQANAKDLRKPDYSEEYDMLRSQMYHQLALDMERGDFFFYSGCPHLAELKQELLYHQFAVEDKSMKVESKDKIKLRLGKSPDLADALVIAYFNKKRISDHRYDKSRIGL